MNETDLGVVGGTVVDCLKHVNCKQSGTIIDL